MLDATAGQNKWQQNLTNSTASIKAGVQAVTTAPGQAAAKAADKWQAKLQDPATKAKFAANVGKVSLADWQNAVINTGIGRIASGAAKGASKYGAFAQKFYPFLQNVKGQIDSMPSTTLEDNIARMTAQVRAVAQFKNQ